MPLGSGFGEGKMGLDPFGQTNFARKILLENLPDIYKEEDIKQGFLFTKFIQSLYPNTNEFRNYLDRFPMIRSPEDIPTDEILFTAFMITTQAGPLAPKVPNPELQIVSKTLPFAVPGNILRVYGESDDPFKIFNIAVISVDLDYSRIRVGSKWPFSTRIRDVEFNNVKYKFLLENNSDFIYVVPTDFPDIIVGDFIQIGDNRVTVISVNKDMFRITLAPIPPIARISVIQGKDILDGETFTVSDGIHAPVIFEFDRNNLVGVGNVKIRIDNLMLVSDVRDAIVKAINDVGLSTLSVRAFPLGGSEVSVIADIYGVVTITETVGNPYFSVFDYSRLDVLRLSRLPLLTFLANDIALDDDATKLEIIRRGIVLHAVQLYRLIGTVRGYQARGGIEGLLVDVYTWNRVPCEDCNFKVRAAGSIETPEGDVISDGYTVTLDDGRPFPYVPTVFEFNKTGGVVSPNEIVEIDDTMSASQVADVFAEAIRNVGSSLLIEVALVENNVIQIRNTQAGIQGTISQSGTKFIFSPNPPAGPSTLAYTVVILCNPTTLTRDPLLYIANFDSVPADLIFVDAPTTEKYFDIGIPTGHITAISGLRINDGETLVLSDGVNTPTTFEFDKDASVIFGNVPIVITDLMTDVDVKNTIIAAVNGVGATLDITAYPFDTLIGNIYYPLPNTAKLILKNGSPDPAGSIAITETVADTGFTVDGMRSVMEEDLFPVKYPDFRNAFEIVGIRFDYDPGILPNQIVVKTLQADVVVGDILDFGSSNLRTVTAVSALPVQSPGAVITLDLPHGTAGGIAIRATRQPDLTSTGDFLTVADFDYKIVYYDPSTFTGRTDWSLRDTTFINQTVAAVRTRRRVATRDTYDGYSRTAFLKFHLTPVPESLFFTGFENVTKFIKALAEVEPIHVRVIDTQFEASGIITVPIPRVYIWTGDETEMTISIDNYFDTIPAEDVITDRSKQVFVETP